MLLLCLVEKIGHILYIIFSLVAREHSLLKNLGWECQDDDVRIVVLGVYLHSNKYTVNTGAASCLFHNLALLAGNCTIHG